MNPEELAREAIEPLVDYDDLFARESTRAWRTSGPVTRSPTKKSARVSASSRDVD
jgi:hypothetical protein